jgi:hypothetical protein
MAHVVHLDVARLDVLERADHGLLQLADVH